MGNGTWMGQTQDWEIYLVNETRNISGWFSDSAKYLRIECIISVFKLSFRTKSFSENYEVFLKKIKTGYSLRAEVWQLLVLPWWVEPSPICKSSWVFFGDEDQISHPVELLQLLHAMLRRYIISNMQPFCE